MPQRNSYILLLLIICGLSSNAQFEKYLSKTPSDTNGAKTIAVIDSTEIGKPDGPSVSKLISTRGGSIISDDGGVQLIFPSGALLKETLITIQPTTNNAQSGKGKAYWFEPSGIQFAEPVTIVFKYSEEDAKEIHPEFMSFATQNKNGKWTRLEFDDVDSANRTLTGTISHFSGAARVDDIILHPIKSLLRARETTTLAIFDRSKPDNHGFFQVMKYPGSYSTEYYVNGQLNGDEANGKIQSDLTPSMAYYTAPSTLPLPNPVFITVAVNKEVKRKNKKSKMVNGFASCRITIYDVYKVKVFCYFSGRVGLNAKLADSALFYAAVVPFSVALEKVTNFEPKLLENGKMPGIREEHDPVGTQGAIHLTDKPQTAKVSREHPYRIDLIFQGVRVLHMKFRYLMRGGLVTPWTPEELDSWWISMDFKAISDLQKTTYTISKDMKYTVTVEPYKEN